jgi:hypothetical protein
MEPAPEGLQHHVTTKRRIDTECRWVNDHVATPAIA